MRHIVIIDDSATTLAVLRGLSTKIEDATTNAFSDAPEALEHLQSSPADLVILDYSMPKITGMELIKLLRKSELHKTTPIIMLTSSSEQAVRSRAYEVGVTAFLNKPVRAQEFRECIGQHLATNMPVKAQILQ